MTTTDDTDSTDLSFSVDVESGDLTEALKNISLFVGPGCIVYIKASVHPKNPDVGKLLIEAGQNGVYMSTYISAEVMEEGKFCIPISSLTTLSLKTKKPLSLRIGEDKRLKIQSGNLNFRLVCSPWSIAHLQRPRSKIEPQVKIHGSQFQLGARLTTLASPVPGTTPVVNVEMAEKLSMSITDYYRALLYTEVLDMKLEPPLRASLRPDLVQGISSRFAKFDIELGEDRGVFMCKAGRTRLYYPTVQAYDAISVEEEIRSFPEDKRLGEFSVDAEAFATAVAQCSSISRRNKDAEPALNVLVMGNRLLTQVKAGADVAESETRVSSDFAKHMFKISVRHLVETLAGLKGSDCILKFEVWPNLVRVSGLNEHYMAAFPVVD